MLSNVKADCVIACFGEVAQCIALEIQWVSTGIVDNSIVLKRELMLGYTFLHSCRDNAIVSLYKTDPATCSVTLSQWSSLAITNYVFRTSACGVGICR